MHAVDSLDSVLQADSGKIKEYLRCGYSLLFCHSHVLCYVRVLKLYYEIVFLFIPTAINELHCMVYRGTYSS